MYSNENQSAMDKIRESIQSGTKMQAIKEFQTLFPCNLKEAKEAVDNMEVTGNYEWAYYENHYHKHNSFGSQTEIRKARHPLAKVVILLFVIFLVAIIVVPLLFFNTDLFMAQSDYYKIAVESKNGELFETNIRMLGAVNKKGEFLLQYSASSLAYFVELYFDPWTVSDVDNPYFAGKIERVNTSSYYFSETIYDSVNSSYQRDTYYNQNGETVWSYQYTNPAKSKDKLFQNVIVSNRVINGSETTSNLEKYINVNQFLIQKYNINPQTTFDKKNKMVIFKVPETEPFPQPAQDNHQSAETDLGYSAEV
ncbi:MAG: hypothetical protein FWG14_13915 [Peptococcaceae bacterium]|nr:hypothetical protein [Peptococcaceae bacterium]